MELSQFEANIERESKKEIKYNMSTLFLQLTQVLMSRIAIKDTQLGSHCSDTCLSLFRCCLVMVLWWNCPSSRPTLRGKGKGHQAQQLTQVLMSRIAIKDTQLGSHCSDTCLSLFRCCLVMVLWWNCPSSRPTLRGKGKGHQAQQLTQVLMSRIAIKDTQLGSHCSDTCLSLFRCCLVMVLWWNCPSSRPTLRGKGKGHQAQQLTQVLMSRIAIKDTQLGSHCSDTCLSLFRCCLVMVLWWNCPSSRPTLREKGQGHQAQKLTQVLMSRIVA